MVELVAVAVGGAVGAVVRFIVSRGVHLAVDTHLPLGTFVVNMAGSFLMGVVIGVAETTGLPPLARTLIATGFLGAFTTFSTFSLETISLLRAGYTTEAVLNLFFSVLVGLIAIILGFLLVRFLFAADVR